MESNGLGKLLPKGLAAKRRKKKESKEDMSAASSTAASDDVSSTNTNGSSFDFEGDRNPDSAPRSMSMGKDRRVNSDVSTVEEEDASLGPYESEGESPILHPTLSSHPSQVGYLTTSSPLVQAVHQPETQSPDSDRASKSSTFPSHLSDSAVSESRISRAQTALVPPNNAARRSPSPAGRIKGIFRSKKSSSSLGRSSSPEKSTVSDPDRESDRSSTLETAAASVQSLPRFDGVADDSNTARASFSEPPSRGQNKINTSVPPRTPPSSGTPAPVIVNTPPTPTDPGLPSPTKPAPVKQSSNSASSSNAINGVPAPPPPTASGFAPGHRRLRSGSAGPSKLSSITLPPLTPTPENSVLPSTPSSGFFSSVLSAAQNAANTLTNTIQNTNIGPNKGTKTGSGREDQLQVDAGESVQVDPIATDMAQEQTSDKRELAITTLGAGDLSLSHLGLSDTPPMSATSKLTETEGRARSESVPTEPSSALSQADTALDELRPSHRPLSMHDSPGAGDRTPPTASINEDKSGLQRSGSIRSAIGRRATRGRGNSTATGGTGGTGTTIGAAITAAHASVAHPRAYQSTSKLPQFAIASKKRNRDFHNQFKSVPDDDWLIEDYSCALQREILAHGRLYVSEGHLCFSSNIIGWVTTLVMSFDEIVSVEKRSTALIFKNGLMISTLQNKHIFASFTNRDSTYDLIIQIWQRKHATLKSSLNGVRQDGIGGDKTERVDEDEPTAAPEADDESASGSESDDDDIYDEDDEDSHLQEPTQATEVSVLEQEGERSVARKASGAVGINGETVQGKELPAQASGAPVDFPGPTSHAPTDCGDVASHYDKIVGDDVIPAPIGKVFSMLFGTQSVTWVPKFLTGDQKCTELQMEDKKGLSTENKSRTYSYVRPLSGSIGPKQTRCIISENVDNIDWEKAVNMNVTTQNPDVPSGNVFCVKTKYCLSWAEKDCTRVQVNCTIEWSGKSWLKGPIENGARDGQTTYCKDLFAALKASLPARPGVGVAQKGKKRRKARQQQSADITDSEVLKPTAKKDWGLLEPVRPFAEPVVDIVQPILTGNVVYGLLVGLLVASWFGFGSDKSKGAIINPRDAARMYDYPERVALYEEMWGREESELWSWLEERVGMERLASDPERKVKRAAEPRVLEERVAERGMDERDVEEAIRVTEEKLKVLKQVVGRKKNKDGGAAGET